MAITAKVTLGSKIQYGQDEHEQWQMSFYPDYNDGRNKEWSLYTPSLSTVLVVIPEVAARFKQGQAYTLTFEENND